QQPDQFGIAGLGAPGAGPGDEHAAQVLFGDRASLSLLGDPVGLHGDTEPADVADVLPDGQGTVDVVGAVQLGGGEGVVLGDECVRAGLELRPVLLGPPVVQAPVAVIAAALVIETVPDLVTDDGAD